MRSQVLFDGITGIRDDLVENAKTARQKKSRIRWIGAVAAVLVVAVFAGILLRPETSPILAAHAIAVAEYPTMAPYPDESKYFNETTQDSEGFSRAHDAWWESIKAQRRDTGYEEGLEDFLTRSTQEFLSGKAGENVVYSPLNVYMALAMLAETVDGEGRQQVLSLLGAESLDALRSQANDLWNANYRQDSATSSVLAASLWLDQDIAYKQAAMDDLANYYYASSYQGDMGSAEFNKALQQWLNDQTGGLLEEQAAQIEMTPETVLSLAATIYFKSKWRTEFSERFTETGVFHAADGDVETDFMHQRDSQNYYWGENFAAISRGLESGGRMWFLLPDEGVTAESLMADPEAMEFILQDVGWENSKFLKVNQSIPKFDVVSQLDLKPGLQALGITDVFSAEAADFSPILVNPRGAALSKIQHDARVAIDEEGVTAAAYTVMMMAGATEPPAEEVDFVLDRPFLFAITGANSLPLFVGVVNQPQ